MSPAMISSSSPADAPTSTTTTSSSTTPNGVNLSSTPKVNGHSIGHGLDSYSTVKGMARPWTEENEKILNGPFDYLLSHPGKDVRRQLIAAFNIWLHVPDEALDIITKVVAMLHTASLLVDDVEDNSDLRRGIPVAHKIFGVAQTINSANYVYFCALQELGRLNNPDVLKIFTEELINLHRGQGMDLYWRDCLKVPTEEDYLEMVSNKTGGLFRLAAKLMQACSTSTVDLVPLVSLLGLIFQVRDDYMNLQSEQYAQNKGFAEDLTEGKFSFPIIHSINADTSNVELINILKQRTTNLDVKKYAVAYMEKTGSFHYTRGVLKDLEERAVRLLKEKGGNAILEGFIERLRLEEDATKK